MNALSSKSDVHYEEMSPSLLAQQPPSTNKPQRRSADWGRLYNHLEGRLQGMRQWRYSWWLYWQQLAQYILPRRYKWLVTANTMWRGQPINNSIIDGTGTLAMQVCASGMWTGLTSPSRPWFKLGLALKDTPLDRDGQVWLTDTTARVSAVMHQSNFYTVMAQAFQDVATFGTAPVVIYEDVEDVIRLYLPCAGEYYLALDGRMAVTTFDREYTMTVQQIVDMFGLENCPPEVQDLWNEGGVCWSNELVVAHSIEVNNPLQPYGKFKGQIQVVSSRFTFREVYWLRGQDTGGELSRRGFHEKPFVVARWSTVANDPYGRGPGMDALGDIKQLQLETLRKGELIDKMVRPPMGADVELKNEPSSIRPGEITYMDVSTGPNNKKFFPLFEVDHQGLPALTTDIKEVQQRIDRYFFVDVFMAITQMQGVQPRNELELTKRDLERLQQLGPFITLFENEFAAPALARIVAIMQRKGLLKPMPDSLKRLPLQIEFQSILRLAQMSAEAVQMKDFLVTVGTLSSAAKAAGVPDPIRIVNLDEAARRYASIVRFDPDLLFTKDEVERHDAEHLHQQQAMQAAQATPQMVDAAKTLSDTKLDGNSALTAMLGGQGRPGGGA